MKKYLLIIIVLYLLAFVTCGTYFEAYESVLSSFVQGMYTKPDIYDWNLDWHFLLFPLYARLNILFPALQVFGIVLFAGNLICLTFTGIVLSRFLDLQIKEAPVRFPLFIVLFSLLMLDSFMNLSSTRIVFITLFSIFAWLEYNRLSGVTTPAYQWILFLFAFLILGLIRMDAVFLSGSIYILFLLFHKRFYKLSLLPLLTGGLLLFIYMYWVMPNASPERQAFYYNELDLIDRDNVDYEKLTPLLALEVDALRNHSLFDKEMFSADFYNHISKPVNGFNRMLNGFNLKYAFITLRNSGSYYLSSACFILFSLISCVLLILHFRGNRKKWIFYLFGCLFLPVFVCIYVITPSRFLVPYYTFAGCLNILLYIHLSGNSKRILRISVFILLLQFFLDYNISRSYALQQKAFEANSIKLAALQKQGNTEVPAIIHMLDSEKFFPLDPLAAVKSQKALFLNFYYFNSYGCYMKGWEDACHCNPLSLKDKIDYMVHSGNLFIISDPEFDFLQKYFNEKYHLHLQKTDMGNFDADLRIFKLSYI